MPALTKLDCGSNQLKALNLFHNPVLTELFCFDNKLTALDLAEDVLRLLPRGTHDPAMFIKPAELRAALQDAGLVPGAITGLGPRGINRRGDLTFGPLPLTAILYMGIAHKPAAVEAAT